MTQTRTRIYFSIKTEVDGFDLTRFNQFLTLSPTEFDIKHSRGAIPKCTSWNYVLPEIHHLDVDEELNKLVAKLTPHIDEFNKLKEAVDVSFTLQVVLYHGEHAPALHFGSEVLAFVHSIGAVIDCDLYNEK